MSEELKKLKNIPFSKLEEAPPFTKWLNGTLLNVEENGSLEINFEVRKEMCNPVGLLHGGMHSAILDDMIGFTVTLLQLEHLYLSVNLNVDFLGSASEGETVRAKSRVVRKGKTIVHAEAALYNQKDKLISKAASNLVNTGKVMNQKIAFG